MKNFFTLALVSIFLLAHEVKAQIPALQWVKQIGGSFDDVGNAIAIDDLGNIYIVGSFSTIVDFDPGPGTYTMSAAGSASAGGAFFVTKLSPNGDLIWAKQLPGSYQAYSGMWTQITSIQMVNSSDIYIAGTFAQSGDFNPGPGTYTMTSRGANNNPDIFVCKLDTGGNFAWATQIGDIYLEYYKAMTADQSGNVYISGTFQGTVDFDNGPGTATLSANPANSSFICKLNSSGNFVWVKQLKDGDSNCHGLFIDGSGNVLVTGENDANVDFDPGAGVVTHSAGGFVLKLDPSGSYLWSDAVPGGLGRTVSSDASGNVYVAGKDIFRKYASGGTLAWSQAAPEIIGLMVDAAGDIYVSGNTSNNDLYIAILDGGGNSYWSSTYGGPADDKAHYICHDNNGFIYVTGEFRETCDMDPGNGSYTLTAQNFSFRSDIFIQKLSSGFELSAGIKENTPNEQLNVYPNPSNGLLFINSSANANLDVFDAKGVLVKHRQLKKGEDSIQLNDLQEGLYMLMINGDQRLTKKIVIQK